VEAARHTAGRRRSALTKTSSLTLDLEIQQHLGSLKRVITIIIWIRDTGCYTSFEMLYGHKCGSPLIWNEAR
jgi:hypothetical protein